MRSTAVTLAMILSPTIVLAQVSAGAKTDTRASATVEAPRTHAGVDAQATTTTDADVPAPSSFSARARANLVATFRRARAERVPEQPLRDRVAEGEAKGASTEQILVSTAMLEMRLVAAQRAMIRAGHTQPSDAEVERGADAEATGYTSAQLEAVARGTPPERSLVVAFDVLTKLAARGVSTNHALAEVESRLDARSSDEALASLAVSGSASANATADAGNGAAAGANAAGNAAAGVNAATRGAGAVTGSIAGSVGGAVTGALGRRP